MMVRPLKLATRLSEEVERLGYYSSVSYQTFLSPDFSPIGDTRKVISWLLGRMHLPEWGLKRAFQKEIEAVYVPPKVRPEPRDALIERIYAPEVEKLAKIKNLSRKVELKLEKYNQLNQELLDRKADLELIGTTEDMKQKVNDLERQISEIILEENGIQNVNKEVEKMLTEQKELQSDLARAKDDENARLAEISAFESEIETRTKQKSSIKKDEALQPLFSLARSISQSFYVHSAFFEAWKLDLKKRF